MANKEIKETRFISLEEILGRNENELSTLVEGVFVSKKLGPIPYTSLEYPEYKQAKKDSMKFVKGQGGRMQPELDDDKLMILVIIDAVDKDTRSDFTFANPALLQKLGVATAEAAVQKLLQPGEILNFAMDVQDASGFGQESEKETSDAVKN